MGITTCLAILLQLQSPALEVDFSTATTGQGYRIDLVVRTADGKVLASGPVNIGVGADAGDIRDTVGDLLGDSGLEILPAGVAKLRLVSKDGVKLGAITYDTFVKGLPTALAGPKLLSATGGASLTVNGVVAKP